MVLSIPINNFIELYFYKLKLDCRQIIHEINSTFVLSYLSRDDIFASIKEMALAHKIRQPLFAY